MLAVRHRIILFVDNLTLSSLQDKDILFIVIRSSSPEVVPRVVQIAQETKRLRHRADEDDEELYQYVSYDQEKDNQNTKKKTKRVIKLDDVPEPSGRKEYVPTHSLCSVARAFNQSWCIRPSYKPLTVLTIHLSKIAMPELAPQGPSPSSSRPRPSSKPNSSSPRPNQTTPSSRPVSSPAPKPLAPQQPSRLSKPSPDPARTGRHGRSSSAEPRPKPSGGQQYPTQNPNNLSPNIPRPRPTSSYGGVNTDAYSPPPWMSEGGAPQMPMPRPVSPAYPAQPTVQPQQQQQQQQQQSGAQQALSMLGKLLSRI